ncbi:hypothetical protein PENTCL1PPCAC_13635, partial [Pristionchus entomophagus]
LSSPLLPLPFLDRRERRFAHEGNAVHQLVEGVEDGAEVLAFASTADQQSTHRLIHPLLQAGARV